MTIYTNSHIGKREYAKKFFETLEQYDILPDKIGMHEPLKEEYTLERAIELWEITTGKELDFRLGMMIGKKNEPNVRFDVEWSIGKRARVNHIDIWFTLKSFKQYRNEIEQLFINLLSVFNSFYGYITDFGYKDRQHVTGTIQTRMSGVFWCNFFGKLYIDFFGKDKLLNAPWKEIKTIQGGLLTYLTDEPNSKELRQSTNLEDNVKDYLGKIFFGDRAEFLKNPAVKQIRNVPKVDLSELQNIEIPTSP
jgi:hypothetical protein